MEWMRERISIRPLCGGCREAPFFFRKKDGPGRIGLPQEVMYMLAATWLMISTLLYSLQLNTGSFPRPLSEEEERHYLALAQAGDLDARNILIERNLRLVAHIMKKY